MTADRTQMHATAVAVGGAGCLILGTSGSGKSTLAVEMIALGADLISDDRVDILRAGSGLVLGPPATIAGLIEVRGCGFLQLPFRSDVALELIVDLDHPSPKRLPDGDTHPLLGVASPVIFGQGRAGLASILVTALRHGGFIEPPAPAEASDRGPA